MSWGEGYVSDVEYIDGYFRELNPLTLNVALAAYGYQPLESKRVRYLELGFGQGLSLAIHAAASEHVFWGCDFNPSQVIHAQQLLSSAGVSAHLFDDAFEAFARRTDLPMFDVIALHGVWSWVSPENRAHVVNILRQRLAPGGIVFVSYNPSPGRSTLAPLQHLLMQHARNAVSESTPLQEKVRQGLGFVDRLIEGRAAYFEAMPALVQLTAHMKQNDPVYLAHEYYNAHWEALSFKQTANLLADARLDFVGDAFIKNHFTFPLLSPAIQQLLTEIKDPVFYQSVRDFCVAPTFRRDVWVKGGCKITPLQRLQYLAEIPFVLLRAPAGESISVTSQIGEIKADERISQALLTALAQDSGVPKTPAQLSGNPMMSAFPLEQICDALLLLCGEFVGPAYSDEVVEKTLPHCTRLNNYLMQRRPASRLAEYLASPVTGGGVVAPYTHQLFLLALQNGHSTAKELAEFALRTSISRNDIMSDASGNPITDGDAAMRELYSYAEPFLETHLPTFKRLKVGVF